MPQLLVSVRSAHEARQAVAGGASIIDVKEPSRGSLGRADLSVWREVRAAVSDAVPVSVALGELSEWLDPGVTSPPPSAWLGISYRKLGLAHSSADWRTDWSELRASLDEPDGPPWIAVAYADWQIAGAPDPDSVLEAALESSTIVGVLVDTWDKRHPSRFRSRVAFLDEADQAERTRDSPSPGASVWNRFRASYRWNLISSPCEARRVSVTIVKRRSTPVGLPSSQEPFDHIRRR